MIIEDSVEVAAAPGRVFDILVDPVTWFKLDPTLVDVTPRKTLALGSTGTMRNRRAPGLVAKASFTTVTFVPGVNVTQELRGWGYKLTEAVALSAHGTGTRMTVTDTLVPTSLGERLMVALSRGIMERDLRTRFAALKALLDAEPAPGG